MKEIALICPPEAETIGRLVTDQDLETKNLFMLTTVPWTAVDESDRAIEKIAQNADGVVTIVSDRCSPTKLGKMIEPFTLAGTPLLGLRVYPDDPAPEALGDAQTTDLSRVALSEFIDSLGLDDPPKVTEI